MRYFGFDPNEKEESPKKVEQKPSSDFFTILLSAILAVISFVGVKLIEWYSLAIKYSFTHTSQNEQANKAKRLLGIILILLPPYLLYSCVPSVRDYFTLSNTHTINISAQNSAYAFPSSRSLFVQEEGRRRLTSKDTSIVYYTFAKSKFRKASFRLEEGECQLIPRGEEADIFLWGQPRFAVGFENEVLYYIKEPLTKLPWYRTTSDHILTPSLLFKSNEEKSSLTKLIHKETTWGEMLEDWSSMETYGNLHSIEVKAKSNEHALICG